MTSRLQFQRSVRRFVLCLASTFLLAVAPAWAASSYDGWGVQQVDPAEPGSGFGGAVAVDGDLAVVGSHFWANGSMFSHGRVQAYRFADGTWEEESIILPDEGHQNMRFGISVALSGDLLLVGAPGAIVNGINNHGAAFVFRRVEGGWVQEAMLAADEPTNGNNFAASVAISGARALVSAENRNIGGQANAGAVYAFRMGAEGWEQEARLQPAQPVGAGRFGSSLAVHGERALIGSMFAVVNGIANGGAAYVFDHDGSAWVESARIVPSDHAAHQQFGHTVSVDGDRLVVGAPRTAINGVAFTGAAYVFEAGSSGWAESARLVAGDGGANEIYADSVSLDGDRLLVGASRATIEGASQVGAAYLYELDGADWEQVAKLGALDPAAGEYSNFGQAVGLSGNRIVVGQPNLQVEFELYGAVSFFVPLEEMAFQVSPQVVAGLGSTDPDTAQVVPYGESISFQLLPAAGYHVEGVDSDCEGGSLEGETFVVPSVEASCSFQVSFAINPPTVAMVVSGSDQETVVNHGFGEPLVVRLSNDAELPVPGIEVLFTSPASGAGAQHVAHGITDANGEVEIEVVANSVAGSYSVSAASESIDAPAVFTLANTPDAPAQLRVLQGDGQQARVGQVFPLPLAVQVLDAWNNAVPGVEVSYVAAPIGASASLSPPSVQSDAQGLAHALATANAVVGTHAVQVSAAGLAPSVFQLKNLESDVQLSVSLSAQQPYVAYGRMLDVLVTVSNTGQDTVSGAQVEMPVSDQLDGAAMQWVCLMQGLGYCASSGSGALMDPDAIIPAGGSIAYLVSAPVRMDAAGDGVALAANVNAGALGAAADAEATLVIARHDFELPGGWQPLELPDGPGFDLANGIGLELPGGLTDATLQTVFMAVSGSQRLRIEQLHGQWLRLVVHDQGLEHASRWVRATAGTRIQLIAEQADRLELRTDLGSTSLITGAAGAEWMAVVPGGESG